MAKSKLTIADRFWSKVKFGSGCWEWQGSTPPPGYGRFWLNGRYDGAHRVAWLLARGPIPKGLLVCHHCDNPSCVRPDHLFIGTVQDNSDDMIRKGRQNRSVGEDATGAKLNTEQVFEMRLRYQMGESTATIANEFGVSASAATSAVNGKRWGHLPGQVSMGKAKGERTAQAKMTSPQVIAYRRRYADGESSFALAEEAGVAQRVMFSALTGKTWKHLPGAIIMGRRTGEDSTISKMTDKIVRDAHRRISDGELIKTIAAEVGVSGVALGNAVKGKTWKHLKLPPLPVKGTRGHRQHNSKLDDEKVRQIRASRAAGERVAVLSERFGVTHGVIYDIVSGRRWRHVK